MLAYIVCRSNDSKQRAAVTEALKNKKCKVICLKSIDEVRLQLVNHSDSSLIILADEDITAHYVAQVIPSLPDNTFIFYMSDKISPSDYKMLLRFGNVESTDLDTVSDDISKFFERISEVGDPKNNNKQQIATKQIVVSFLGSSGGVGNTTISMESGIDLVTRLKAKGHSSVALLDMDVDGGAVCNYLGVEERLNLNEISSNPSRLDGYMLEIMCSKHPSGLDLFSSSQRYNISRYKSEDLGILSLLNCIVDNYSITIIDIPYRCPVDSSEILKNSDQIFITAVFSVPGLKKMKLKLEELSELGIPEEKISVVLTDVDTNLIGGISLRFNIDAVIKNLRLFYVRRDRSFAMECVDAGVSMQQTQPRKAICQDIQKISDKIVEHMRS